MSILSQYNCNLCLDTGIYVMPLQYEVSYEECSCGAQLTSTFYETLQELEARMEALGKIANAPTNIEHAKKFSI